MNASLLTCSILLLCVAVPEMVAQDTLRDLTEQVELNDRSRESMINNNNVERSLVGGGAFYVSNPAPVYEADPKIAYLHPDFQPLTVKLRDGTEHQVSARIQLVSQEVEILREGETYVLNKAVVDRITDPVNATYIVAFDPLGRIRGSQLYRVAYAEGGFRLLVHESAAWQDPPRQNMFDTTEPRKTLKRKTRYYLLGPAGPVEINKLRDLLNAGIVPVKQGKQLIKRENLRNSETDYLRLLSALRPEG